ncbi:MAG TPA: PilZ domain-containing protein [Tepidisphaeraceae bacterium]|jgi:hypothetical protein
MQLTAAQFQDIITSLRSDALGGRRTAPRVGMRLQVPIIPCAEDQAQVQEQLVWLKDLSVSGMCFVHSRGLPINSHFVARFSRDRDEPLAVLLEVVRCKKLGPTSYEIGSRIDRVISREELGG